MICTYNCWQLLSPVCFFSFRFVSFFESVYGYLLFDQLSTFSWLGYGSIYVTIIRFYLTHTRWGFITKHHMGLFPFQSDQSKRMKLDWGELSQLAAGVLPIKLNYVCVCVCLAVYGVIVVSNGFDTRLEIILPRQDVNDWVCSSNSRSRGSKLKWIER